MANTALNKTINGISYAYTRLFLALLSLYELARAGFYK
jgi:hypothetical protein